MFFPVHDSHTIPYRACHNPIPYYRPLSIILWKVDRDFTVGCELFCRTRVLGHWDFQYEGEHYLRHGISTGPRYECDFPWHINSRSALVIALIDIRC